MSLMTARSLIEEVNSSDTLTQEELFPLFSRASALVNDCMRLLARENTYIQTCVLELGAEVASSLDRNKALYRRNLGYVDGSVCDLPTDQAWRTECRDYFLGRCMDLQLLMARGDVEGQVSLLLKIPFTRMIYENFVKDWYSTVVDYEKHCLKGAGSSDFGVVDCSPASDTKCYLIEKESGLSPGSGFGVVRYIRIRLEALRKIYDRIFTAYSRVILKTAKSQSVSDDHSLDCLAGDTLVWTDQGIKRLDDVGPCLVQTTVGTKRAYPHVIDAPKNLETVTSTSRLGLSLTGTPDHKIKVLNEDDHCLEWVSLSDSVGRYAAVAVGSELEWPAAQGGSPPCSSLVDALSSPKPDTLSFLSSVLETSVEEFKEFTGECLESAQVVQHLLLRAGLVSSLSVVGSVCKLTRVGDYAPEMRLIFDEIVCVEPSGIRPVYDISVDDESHEFVANGYVVSNCFQNGSFGLLRAISSYDNASNARFAGHARWWIRQSMLYSIKEDSNTIRVSSNTWQHYAKLESLKAKFEVLHGSPTLGDLSSLSGYTKSHIESIYSMVKTSQVKSLDHPLRDDGSSTLLSVIDADASKSVVSPDDPTYAVKSLLDRLPTLTRNLVCLSYGLTEYVHQNIQDEKVESERLRQVAVNT